MATINKLNKTVVAGERTRATDFNAVSGKVDELVQQVNTNTATFPNKADVNHTHNYATPQQISSLQSQINGKANASHEHYISDVDGLEDEIEGMKDETTKKGLKSFSSALTNDNTPCVLTLASEEKTLTASIDCAKKQNVVIPGQPTQHTYKAGLLSSALAKRLFNTFQYMGDVPEVSNLPTLESSSELDVYRVMSDNSLRIRFDNILWNLIIYSFSLEWRGTVVYSGTLTSDDVIDLENTGMSIEHYHYAKLRIGSRGQGNYLVACDSDGTLVSPTRIYSIDSSSNTPLKTEELTDNKLNTGSGFDYSPVIATATDQTKTVVKPYWFIINGLISYSDDGTTTGGGSSDSGSTDSGGTSGGSTDSGDTGGGGDAASGTITVDFDSCLYTDSLTVQNTTKGTSVTVNSSNTTATLAVSVGDTIKYSSVKSSTAAADTANNMLGSSSIGWGATTHVIVESDFSKSAYCWWG